MQKSWHHYNAYSVHCASSNMIKVNFPAAEGLVCFSIMVPDSVGLHDPLCKLCSLSPRAGLFYQGLKDIILLLVIGVMGLTPALS